MSALIKSGRMADQPKLQYSIETWVTRQAAPRFHPLVLEKLVKTSLAEFLGAMTQIGMIVTKKPPKCPKSEIVSIRGSDPEPKVLKRIVTARKASMRRVYCQFENAYSSFLTPTSDWINVVQTKTELAVLANQPNVLIQPAQ